MGVGEWRRLVSVRGVVSNHRDGVERRVASLAAVLAVVFSVVPVTDAAAEEAVGCWCRGLRVGRGATGFGAAVLDGDDVFIFTSLDASSLRPLGLAQGTATGCKGR